MPQEPSEHTGTGGAVGGERPLRNRGGKSPAVEETPTSEKPVADETPKGEPGTDAVGADGADGATDAPADQGPLAGGTRDPSRQWSAQKLIERGERFLGFSPHDIAGALCHLEADAKLTLAEADALVKDFLAKPVERDPARNGGPS